MAEQFLKIRLHGSILQLKPEVCKMGVKLVFSRWCDIMSYYRIDAESSLA